jgi:hypothetical protein
MLAEQEVRLKIRGILGTCTPFYQGGVIRLTIPKRVVKKYNLEEKVGKEFFSMIFVETDKGMLLLPLEKIIRPDTIRDALNFIDLSKISDEELKALLEE